MTTQLALLDECPIANCHTPVSRPGQPCGPCLQLFGEYLAPATRPDAETPEQYAERTPAAETRACEVLTAQRELKAASQTKRNQTCWCCEQRRTCRPDPDRPELWICNECEVL